MYNIVIIGSGRLGSRHLQSLAAFKKDCAIHVIDPSEESLKIAADLFNSSDPSDCLKIKTYKKIQDLPSIKIDVAIIATNSLIRSKVIEDLINHTSIDYLILEKFLFPKLEDYTKIDSILEINKIKAWVNCPRRMYPIYQELKKQISGPTTFNFTGSNWGIGCNGIHLLDLVAFLSQQNNFVLDNSLMDKDLVKSKRDGYIDFTGTLKGYTSDLKNTFTFNSYADEGTRFTISFQNKHLHFIINEPLKKIIILNTIDYSIEEKDIIVPFQTNLTIKVVEQLLDNGNCDLTTYNESQQLHKLLLKEFLDIVNYHNESKTDLCPVT